MPQRGSRGSGEPVLSVGSSIYSRAYDSQSGSGSSNPVRSLSVGKVSARRLAAFHLFVGLVDAASFTTLAVTGPEQTFKIGGIMNFLTLWGQLTQAIFMFYSFYVDLKVARDVELAHDYMMATGSGDDDEYFLSRVLTPTTEKTVFHRDRFFTLVFVTGNCIGLGYWCLLFPHSHYVDALHSYWFWQTIAAHGFTFVMIWVETLITRHRYTSIRLELGINLVYCCSYVAWNLFCHHINGKWAYPPIQDNRTFTQELILYPGAVVVWAVMYFVGRALNKVYWPSRARSAMQHTNQPLLGRGASVEVGVL